MATPTLRIAKLTEITPDPQNANRHTERGRNTVERSLRERGFFRPMAAAGKGVPQPVMLAGNLTQETAVDLGMDEAIIVETDGTRPIVHVRTDLEPGTPEAILLGLEDNRAAELSINFDPVVLRDFSFKLDLAPLWTDEELKLKFAEMNDGSDNTLDRGSLPDLLTAHKSLSERFIVPPFSVLDARQGYWQERKRAWLALGIQSELGRGGGAPGRSPRPAAQLTDSGHTTRGDGYGRAL